MTAVGSSTRLLVFSLILAFVAGVATPLFAQKMVCAGCGKPITTGEWIQAEGKIWHPEHFVCANCNKPIGKGEYFTKNGDIYDRACYEKQFSPRCAFCGRILTGTFTTFDGKSYHPECYTEHVAPRCGVCGKPLEGKYVTFEGKTYHEGCYQQHVAITCAYCGGIIEGKYLKDYWGNSYHEVHKGKAPECDFCQRLITPELNRGSRTWSDGRTLCGLCAPSAVTNPDVAESLLIVAAVKLRLLGIDVDPSRVRVSMVDRKALVGLSNMSEKTIRGFTSYREATSLFGLIKDRKLDIYILYGMPRVEAISALTHELMHVWQYLDGQLQNDKALCEGSCNYASYLILKEMSGPEVEYVIDKLMNDPDPYYGDGFRKVMAYVNSHGRDQWLTYLKTTPTAPW